MGIPTTVPYPYDVIIDGNGYVFADSEEQKAAFGLTPVYVPRQNTQGDFGDNQQDFWLTWSQKDWSKGDGQRYQGRDDDGKSRYWAGLSADSATVPGEVSIGKGKTSITMAANPTALVADTLNDRIYFTTSTNLYYVTYDGTITTTPGAHGLGTSPSKYALVNDGRAQYMSGTGGGTVGVRKWSGAAFSTFSATAADALAFLNNTLYGYVKDSNKLIKYDSGGTASDVFLWRDAAADATGYSVDAKLVPFGGKLLILRYRNSTGAGPDLWQYDGTATSKLTEFPVNFKAYDCAVLNGTVFVSGVFEKHVSSTIHQRPAVYFYKDGQQDVLWQAWRYGSTSSYELTPPLAAYQHGMLWTDLAYNSRAVFYDASGGGTNRLVAVQTAASGLGLLAATGTFFLYANTGSTTGNVYPSTSGADSSGFVFSSLVDFDTSLRKVFRGVRVEWDAATDGDGGSVDISTRYNDIDDALTYTNLQTGAVSGTEYVLATPAPGFSYRALSVLVTLNKGTSTDGPKLKRVLVRAVPVQPGFKKRQYVLLIGGRDGDSPVRLRDGQLQALDGAQMAANLETSAARTAPFTIVDHLSGPAGFTGVIEALQMMEYKPEQWIATVSVRQV